MRPTSRLLVGAFGMAVAAAVVALPSSPATRPFIPRLLVSSYGASDRADTRFSTYVQHGAPATAEVDLYVPAAYVATLGQTPGSQIGTISGLAEDRGLTAPFTSGTVLVADASEYANTNCDSAAHSAVWVASLRSSTTTLTFPIFVRAQAQQPTELHWCLPKDGPQLASVSFDLHGVLIAPARGRYVWDARFSPYDPKTGSVVSSEQASSLVTVRLPQRVALSVRYSHKTHVYRLRVHATADGEGARGEVRIFRSVDGGPFITTRATGGTPMLTTTGTFTFSGHLSTTKDVRLRAHFVANPPTNRNCGSDINGVPCVSSTGADWETDSNTVTIHP